MSQSSILPSHLAERLWIESIRSRFSASFHRGASLNVNFGLEFNYNFFTINPWSQGANSQTCPPLTYYYDLLIHRADIEYGFFGSENASLKVQLGYFPFKYNPQAKNLGEYLFRSGTYPNFIVNEFYFPQTRLLGTNLEGAYEGVVADLQANVFLTSEMTYPVQDFSLAGLVNADFVNGALELGGGVQLQRLISVKPERTTPRSVSNISNVDSFAVAGDSMGYDTSYYTYTGAKLMSRFCFDVKKLVPMGIFGDEDLKLYAELAVLGVKNYGTYYDNITERMPLTMGFNFPAFKYLDLFAIEAEYYSSPYFNDNTTQLYAIERYMPATPYVIYDQADDPSGHGKVSTVAHHWKWSVFLMKRFGGNFQIVAQAARDHSRFQDPMNRIPYVSYNGDVTIGADDWYFLIRLMWTF
jgi:hypothetical protein